MNPILVINIHNVLPGKLKIKQCIKNNFTLVILNFKYLTDLEICHIIKKNLINKTLKC